MALFKNYHVKDAHVGQTVAAVLREMMPGKSWADVKQLLHGRHVQVNGNLTTDESRRVRGGDVLKVWTHALATPPGEADVRIIYLDADLVVVEKPAGLTTLRHAEERDWSEQRKSRQPTLDDLLPRLILRHPAWGKTGAPASTPNEQDTPTSAPKRGHPLFGKIQTTTPNAGKINKPGASARDDMRPSPQPGKSGRDARPSARGGKSNPRDARPNARDARAPARDARPNARDGRPNNRDARAAARGAFKPGAGAMFERLPDVRPVHRLDRDTSGLMVFALSPRAETALVGLFKGHDITRSYLAVAHGVVEARTIAGYLIRDRGDGRRGSSPRGKDADGAQHAVTHIKPIEDLAGQYTLIECRLETGRTHQIRIHLAEAGHMLCGERTYHVAPNGAATHDTSGAPRQALHAHELGFVHPISGKPLHFKSPLPPELATWLTGLRARVQRGGGQ